MSETDIDLSRGLYRRIYSGATKGRRINSVSERAELVFWRLHLVSDDFGRFEADPYLISIQALPRRREITESDICLVLFELVEYKLIKIYEVNGEKYGEILDFSNLQPAPKNGRKVRRFPENSGEDRESVVNPGESGFKREIPASYTHTHTHTQNSDTADAGSPLHPDVQAVVSPPAESSPKGKSPKASRSPAKGNHAELIRHHAAVWSESRGGETYPFHGAKDGAAVGRILKACGDDLAKAKRIVSDFVSDSDPFYAGGGSTLAILSTHISRYLSRLNAPVKNADDDHGLTMTRVIPSEDLLNEIYPERHKHVIQNGAKN